MSLSKLRLALLLGGLYLFQLAYLAVVGLPTGMWDLAYTRAEHKMEKTPPFSPATVERFRRAAQEAETLVPEDGRLARTYHDLGTLLWITGNPHEGRVYLHRALRIFEQTDGRQATWVGIVCERLGEVELRRGHNLEALEWLQRAEGILVRTLGGLDPIALRGGALLAVHTRSPEKARQVMENYRLAAIPVDPVMRLQLEQIGGSSILPPP
jgi:hypothetical protein